MRPRVCVCARARARAARGDSPAPLWQADDADTDDQSEIARSEASTRGACRPSLGPGSKRAHQLMEAVQRSRPDRLTEAKLEALNPTAHDPAPAHFLRSHAVRSHPAAVARSPQREHVQMKMVSFSVQTRSPGVRRAATTPEGYVGQAIDNGDGADLLRVSCALGFLLSGDSRQAEPSDAMSYIDDAVLAATKAFRSCAARLVPAVEQVLGSAEDKAGPLLNVILLNGLKEMRGARRIQRTLPSTTSFLYHEVAKPDVLNLDSMGKACFCVCMWTFVREQLGEQKKPCIRVSAASESQDDFWISIRCSPRGGWRHFSPSDRGVREEVLDAVASSPPSLMAMQPYMPLHMMGAVLLRFWAAALNAAAKRAQADRVTTSVFCGKWLSHILELDVEKGLGLAQSLAFVSRINVGLEEGRIADRHLPDLVSLVARHAAERPDVPMSPLRGGGQGGGSSDGKALWSAYDRMGVLVACCSGAAGGPGGGGGGHMQTLSVVRAAEHVGESADVVMSRAQSALRRGGI